MIYSFLALLIFACVHFLKIGKLAHEKVLTIGGGFSIAYVFIDLLPKIGKQQQIVLQSGIFPYIEKHAYLLALFGFLTFFAVDRSQKSSIGVWFSFFSYSLFNFFVGYAISDLNDPEVKPLLLFTLAMALHYLINDQFLNDAHPEFYQKIGRYLLSFCLVAGWFTGFWIQLPPAAVALVTSFIAGGVIMNVIRHELPKKASQTALTLSLSALAYTLLLLFVGDSH